jgi:hypothetical protein
MKIESVIICEAASVREGLLNILGGGITRLWAHKLPTPLNTQWAVELDTTDEEMGRDYPVTATLVGPDGSSLLKLARPLKVNRPARLEPGESVLVHLLFDVRHVPAREYGRYEAVIEAGNAKFSRPFWLLHPDELLIPPLG